MSYDSKLASFLSGATRSQLDGWAKSGVLRPEISSRPRRYSFRDVVALRTIAKLRSKVSLQKIRAALATLHDQEFNEHLSTYRFATDGESVKLWTDEGWLDLVSNPGQWELYTFEDIYGEFPNWKNRIVPPLLRPHEGIEIDPQKMHGTPVLTGTRVPFDLVIDLCSGDEAMDMEELKDAYPSLDRDAIEHALDFESAVKEWSA